MDPDVSIISKEDTDEGWEFVVEVKDSGAVSQHTVALDEEYFEQFTFEAPEEMILASFYFLLDHERAEEILPAFNVHMIGEFFPDYEDEVENLI